MQHQQYNATPQYPQQTPYNPANPPGFPPQPGPAPASWPPQPGPAPGSWPAPVQGPSVVIQSTNVTQPAAAANRVVFPGGCPACQVGVLEDSYGFCAIFLAIFCFPFGFLCCWFMRTRRCSHCRVQYN